MIVFFWRLFFLFICELKNMDEREKKIKDIISWNIALNSSYMNLSCMEASYSLCLKKIQLNKLHRHYLAGDLSIFEQQIDPKINDEKWFENSNEVLEKYKKEHKIRLTELIKSSEESKKEILNKIEEIQKKINFENNKNFKIENNNLPNFDPDAIGDINLIKNKLKESKIKLKLLKKNQKNIKKLPKSIKDVLFNTSPKIPKFNFKNSFF